MPVHRPFTRDQRATIVYGMLAFVLVLGSAGVALRQR